MSQPRWRGFRSAIVALKKQTKASQPCVNVTCLCLIQICITPTDIFPAMTVEVRLVVPFQGGGVTTEWNGSGPEQPDRCPEVALTCSED